MLEEVTNERRGFGRGNAITPRDLEGEGWTNDFIIGLGPIGIVIVCVVCVFCVGRNRSDLQS